MKLMLECEYNCRSELFHLEKIVFETLIHQQLNLYCSHLLSRLYTQVFRNENGISLEQQNNTATKKQNKKITNTKHKQTNFVNIFYVIILWDVRHNTFKHSNAKKKLENL